MCFRVIFLPIMVVTLPLPAQVTQYFPKQLSAILQWFAFWAFACLLVLPFLLCVHRLVTNSLGRTKRIKQVLDDRTAPKTVIVMPVYKEEPEVLIKAINSVVDCDYPPNCIHVFLSYDGGVVDESYLRVIHHLGIPITLKSYPQSIDVTYKGARVTVSRFKHGGKRNCQKQTFKLIDKVYAEYLKRHDNLFVLFIDSDCILDRLCLQNFMYDMELKPGSKRNMLANDWCDYVYNGAKFPLNGPAGHGVPPWPIVRTFRRIGLWRRNLPSGCFDNTAILCVSQDGKILLCGQSGTMR